VIEVGIILSVVIGFAAGIWVGTRECNQNMRRELMQGQCTIGRETFYVTGVGFEPKGGRIRGSK